MTPLKLHIDEPGIIDLTIERDTTPRLDIALYQDPKKTLPIDVAEYTFECYFKSDVGDHNDDATLTFADEDIVKKPDGEDHIIRIPITREQSNDAGQLLNSGVWIIYWTDSTGHRRRLVKGKFQAQQ